MKKIVATVLVLLMTLTVGLPFVAADSDDSRVVLGANITEDEKKVILEYFGTTDGTVPILTLNNQEERAILSGKVPEGKIGKNSLSCVFIKAKSEGGLVIDTNNINWCTSQMYIAALTTAGIENAIVSVTAPRPVSGTAALAGIYKAYEDITGKKLSDAQKDVAASELVLTAELADAIGDVDSTALINELKINLEKTKSMSDEELRGYINETAKHFNVDLTSEQVEQILSFIRTLAATGIDVDKLSSQLNSLKGNLDSLSNAGKEVGGFFDSIGKFFQDIFDWIGNLFK